MWILDVSSTKIIHLIFDSIDIYSSASKCYDYLRIFDGMGESDKIGEDICGQSAPVPITTSGPFARIEFVSFKGPGTSKGFQINFSTLNNQAECGADLTLDYG